jgi:GNAT superfamily N-acetyltransferase
VTPLVCDAVDSAQAAGPTPHCKTPRVRRLRPTDRSAVLAMHARCSRETRYSRWLAPSTIVPPSYLRSLLACTAEHVAVVALADCQPGDVVGLASAAVTADVSWELAVLVEDRHQAQGVGRLMLNSLLDLIGPTDPICAYALFENRWLLGKLERFGTLTFHHDFGLSHVRVERTKERKVTLGEV